MVDMKKRTSLFLGISTLMVFFLLPISVFSLETSAPSTAGDNSPLQSFTVVSLPAPLPSVSELVAKRPISPEAGQPSPPVVVNPVGPSSLTVSEMRLVMNGGRNYDPYTKKWGYRDAFVGEKRNAFMLSWESHRRKSNVNQLLPEGLRYSK